MTKQVSIKLYSVFHKPAPVPAAPFVSPIQVDTAGTVSNMLRHDTGENISELNACFSELTACYWIWKNEDRNKTDAWGLCHYRRYFTLDKRKLLFIKKSRVYYALTQQNVDAVINQQLYNTMQELLLNHDVILQRPVWAHKKGRKKYGIKEAYGLAHDSNDWNVTINILLEKYPEYANSVTAFEQQQKMSYYNMMIARWAIWDEYLGWIFDILFEVKKRVTVSNDAYQSRVFGFLAERLLNLFVFHRKLNAGYLTIALFEK